MLGKGFNETIWFWQGVTSPEDLQKTQKAWKAHLILGFKKSTERTVLASRSQSGPLTVQRPFYPEGDVCHLYLLHPPGGVVGGDELCINVSLKEVAKVLITTPGATKFYRSGDAQQKGKRAKQNQYLQVSNGCSLEWFPQENIFFDYSHCHLVTRIDLEQDAQFMGWEINCYGRPASKELFEHGEVLTRLELYRDGIPLILDGLTVADATQNHNALKSATSLNGFPCFGTFIATQVNKDLLDQAREAVKDYDLPIGLTLMDDILVARCLGEYAEQVSTALKKVWMVLRPSVLQRDACHPRIWLT